MKRRNTHGVFCASAAHDPGKVASDLALSLALGGDCLADLSLLRAEPGVYGAVASEATVSRTLSTLAGDVDAVVGSDDRVSIVLHKRRDPVESV